MNSNASTVNLSCRNPFKMNESLIIYDQSSDEELADIEGEKISEEFSEDGFDQDCTSLRDEGFIVNMEDILSDTSYSDEDRENKRLQERLFKKENYNKLKQRRQEMVR